MRHLLTLILTLLAAAPAAAQDAAQDVGGDHVVIVLDASGSMERQFSREDPRSKMEVAKDALVEVLDTLPAGTNVGLAVFGGGGGGGDGWVYDLQPIDAASVGAVREAFADVRPRGGTPLGAWLKEAADRLLVAREANGNYGTYRLLVISDGKANDQRLVDEYLPDILGRGVGVDVIGVKMREDLALAEQVDSYRRADDPATLSRQLREVLSEIGQGSRDDAPAAEAFETLAPLPDAAAGPMLAALAAGGNTPIGSGPPAAAVEAIQTPAPADAAAPTGTPITRGSDEWSSLVVGTCGGGMLIILLFVVIIMFTFARAMR